MDPELLRVMWERNPAFGAVSAGDGVLHECNPAALRMGFAPGMVLPELAVGRARARLTRLLRRVRAGFEAGGEVSIDLGGRSRTLLLAAIPLGDDRVGWSGWDVTTTREKDARRLATVGHDPLTGLPDRVVWRDRLDQALKRAQRSQAGIGMMFIDLDEFKRINDRYGHAFGDRVLVEVARRIRTVLRPADTLARLGGDEFIVLCESITSVRVLERLGARVADAVRGSPLQIDGEPIAVSCSVGVTFAEPGRIDVDVFMATADSAMYAAKQRGPGQLLATSYEQPSERMRLGLQRALDAGTLPVAVEPVLDLNQGALAGYALEVDLGTREHANDALRSIVGNSGEMRKLVLLIIGRALDVAHEHPDCTVQTLLPAPAFSDEHTLHALRQAIEDAGVDPGRIVLAVDAAGARAERTLVSLRETLGLDLPIALTRFGLHSVDIAALSALRPRICELDPSITTDPDERQREHIVAACAIAHAVGAVTQITVPGTAGQPAFVGVDRIRRIPD